MLRLALIVTLPALLSACTLLNPAFDECDSQDCRAEASGAEQGEGDTGEGGTGTVDDTTGEGDTSDGETGTLPLPSCPNTEEVVFHIERDTFLVAGPGEGGTCFISWDYEQDVPNPGPPQLPCAALDFGGAALHSVCSTGECLSHWLGRFDVEGWQDLAPSVKDAKLQLTAKVSSAEGFEPTVVELGVTDTTVYGNCNTWKAGPGWGEQAGECVTTYQYAALPNEWGELIQSLDLAPVIGAGIVPPSELADHSFTILIDPGIVAGWLANPATHTGVVLRSGSGTMPGLALYAQESPQPPKLALQLCLE